MVNRYFISQEQKQNIELKLDINMDNDDEVMIICPNCNCKNIFGGIKEGIRQMVVKNCNQLVEEIKKLKQQVVDLELELKGRMQENGDIPYEDDIFNEEREKVVNNQSFEICPICENCYLKGDCHSC